MAHLLFAYGTLQLPAVQKAVFGGPVPGQRDAVVGHLLQAIRVTDATVVALSGTESHVVLVPSGEPSAVVEGTAYELDDDQLAAADDYETEGYVRTQVGLRSGRTAWVYVLAEELRSTP